MSKEMNPTQHPDSQITPLPPEIDSFFWMPQRDLGTLVIRCFLLPD